MLHVSNEEF